MVSTPPGLYSESSKNNFMNTTQIEELLDEMTLEEQVSLLTGADFWTTVPIPRLSMPAIKVTDGPNGARGGDLRGRADVPPASPSALRWARPGIRRWSNEAGAALGDEAKLKGARVLLAPTVNLQRTVYNGRNFECYSEDPCLSSELAVAYMSGLQSTRRGGDGQALRRQRERTPAHEHQLGDPRARAA